MIALVVADDEVNIRKGLATLPWKQWGIDLVGVASDGNQAWELIQTKSPDLVLTDIRMPGISGLDLSKRIRDRYPDTVVLLLSGHQDFHYAQEAIANGVFGYLLKPSHPSEVHDLMVRARQECLRRILVKRQLVQHSVTAFVLGHTEGPKIESSLRKELDAIMVDYQIWAVRQLGRRPLEDTCIDAFLELSGHSSMVVRMPGDREGAQILLTHPSIDQETSLTFARSLQNHIKVSVGKIPIRCAYSSFR